VYKQLKYVAELIGLHDPHGSGSCGPHASSEMLDAWLVIGWAYPINQIIKLLGSTQYQLLGSPKAPTIGVPKGTNYWGPQRHQLLGSPKAPTIGVPKGTNNWGPQRHQLLGAPKAPTMFDVVAGVAVGAATGTSALSTEGVPTTYPPLTHRLGVK